MLDTTIYDADLQLFIDNSKAAWARGEREKQDQLLQHFIKLCQYADRHGLVLSTRGSRFCFVRNGYSPAFLYISTIDERR